MRDAIVLQDGDAYLMRVTVEGRLYLHALMRGCLCVATVQRYSDGAWFVWRDGASGLFRYEDLDIALRDMWQLRKA